MTSVVTKQQKNTSNNNMTTTSNSNTDNHKTNGNSRHCRHSHGKLKVLVSIENDAPQIRQDDNELSNTDKTDRLVLPGSKPVSERPSTVSGSVRKYTYTSRPQSRRLDSRPGSSRTVFEHIPGTRPASRRTISRNSNRSRRPDSSIHGFNKGQGHISDSDSDHDDSRPITNGFDTDLTHIDIHDEKAFDTDLEVEDLVEHFLDGSYDLHQRIAYLLPVAGIAGKQVALTNKHCWNNNNGTTYRNIFLS